MIPEIRKILYTTDLSENARHAFSYAVSLANRYGAGVTLLHVLEDISPYADSLVINILGESRWDALRQENEQKIIQTIQERLETFCQEVSEKVPACPFFTERIAVKIGNPVEEILKEAETGGCDLVVMGAHGHGIIGGAMMGSVSRRVLRRCRKPVLVVRLPDKED